MIFIFGTRGTTGNPLQTGQTCPACGTEHAIYVVPQQRYCHLFWIPLFPTSKQFKPVCSSCDAMFTTQKIPVTNAMHSQFKTPKWTFTGLIVFTLLIISLMAFVMVEGSDMKAKIKNPQEGDIYQIEYNNKAYSLMKVASYTPDSIYFYASPGRTNKEGLDMLAEIDAYNTIQKEGYSKEELKKNKIKEFEILKIKR